MPLIYAHFGLTRSDAVSAKLLLNMSYWLMRSTRKAVYMSNY